MGWLVYCFESVRGYDESIPHHNGSSPAWSGRATPAAAQHASKRIALEAVTRAQDVGETTRCCKGALIGATTGAVLGTLFTGAVTEIGSATTDGSIVVLGGFASCALVGWLISPKRSVPAARVPFLGAAGGALLGAVFVEGMSDLGDSSLDGALVVLGGFAAGAVIGWLID